MAAQGSEDLALGVVDFIIFGLTLVIALAIGVYYACAGGKQRTTSEFMVGNRNMSVAPVAISIIVSHQSSIMLLGWPGEIFVYGVQFWLAGIAYALSSFLAAQLLAPLFSELKVLSAYEYLEQRYGCRALRLFGSFLGIMSNLLYLSVVIYGPATALEAVTQFPTWISIILVASCAIIYTAMGGIKAVILANAFQFTIMNMGIFALIIKGSIDAGGMANVWRINSEAGRLNFFIFDLDPTVRLSFWSIMIGMTLGALNLGTNQTSVQRIITMPTVQKAKIIMASLGPGLLFGATLTCLEGLIAYAYYARKKCDPLDAGIITNPNQIIPYFVLEVFQDQPGLSGLFLASLFSGCLGSLSSGYASIGTLLWSDFIRPHVPNISEFKATIIAKILVVCVGVSTIGLAQLIRTVTIPMSEISYSLIGAFSGPLCGLFILGAIFPFANYKGAIVGGVVSMVILAWKGFGSIFSPLKLTTPYMPPITTSHCFLNGSSLPNATSLEDSTASTTVSPAENVETAVNYTSVESGLQYFYSISFLYNAPLGMVGVVVIGLIFSFLTGATKPTDVNPLHMAPFFDRVMCCLPEFIRSRLRCGIDYSGENARMNSYSEQMLGTYYLEQHVTGATEPNTTMNGNVCAGDVKEELLSDEATAVPDTETPA